MTRCSWDSCEKDATIVPEVNVPAQGYPRDSHQPLSMILGLPVCEEHFKNINLEELLYKGGPFNEGLEPVFKAGAAGRQPPDFKRAWLSKIPLDGDKYKNFVKSQEKFAAAQEARAKEDNRQ